MTTLQEIRKKLEYNEKRKLIRQVDARTKADRIISEDFHGFEGSICITILKKITVERAEDLKTWLSDNCKEFYTYNSVWKTNIDGNWYLNFYFRSKRDAASFKIIWG